MNPCTSQTATFIILVSERQKEKKNGQQRRLLPYKQREKMKPRQWITNFIRVSKAKKSMLSRIETVQSGIHV